MIIIEWRKLLEGKDKFEDLEVEQIAQYLLDKMAAETDPLKIIEYNNDLELVLGSGEWLTRKYERLNRRVTKEALPKEEAEYLKEKLARVKARRDEVVSKIKSKYGL